MEEIIDRISDSVPASDNEYMGRDGLLHCAVCTEPVQTKIEIFGKEKIVRCICSCRVKEKAADKEREKIQERIKKRRICFAETNMATWTFENDDGKNAGIIEAMKNYVENFPEFRKNGQGLLLYGPVGTGKSYSAACVANALIDKDYSVLMTNFATMVNQIQGMFEGKQEYINSLNRYSLLIIDDLGAERNTEYMAEQVFNIIDSRYRSGLPMIITTNLTAEELKKPQEVAYSRIYDRVLERCHPVKVDGNSRRKDKLRKGYDEMQQKLGLKGV